MDVWKTKIASLRELMTGCWVALLHQILLVVRLFLSDRARPCVYRVATLSSKYRCRYPCFVSAEAPKTEINMKVGYTRKNGEHPIPTLKDKKYTGKPIAFQ